MAKAFTTKGRSRSGLRELLLPVLFFGLILAFLIAGVNNVSRTTQAEQLKSAEQAVRRAAVQCYALEGRYPKDVDYLEEHYGLMVDREKYVVHYQALGGNLMPQISVFAADAGAS